MRVKCYKCMRPKDTCLCDHVIKVKTKTKFVILIHPMEFKKVKNNTGRITHLSLIDSEFIMSESFQDNNRVNELINTTNAYILYPGNDSIKASQLTSSKENTIFIIDATWPCSKKMLKLSPNLQKLPKISFQTSETSIYSFKKQPRTECLSTIESTLEVLKDLSKLEHENICNEKLESFLNPFKKLIELQIKYENDPNLNGYRRRNKIE